MAMLSKSAQMRRKRAEGFTVGQVARLFGVSYHQAYAAVVTHRASRDTEVASPRGSVLTDLTAAIMPNATEDALFTILLNRDKRKAADRVAAREELDRRDPSGDWLERFDVWKVKARPLE